MQAYPGLLKPAFGAGALGLSSFRACGFPKARALSLAAAASAGAALAAVPFTAAFALATPGGSALDVKPHIGGVSQ